MADLAQRQDEKNRALVDDARTMLTGFTHRAVEILQELAEFGENERTRLSAAAQILDRAGVVAPVELKVTATPEEHALIRGDAEETLARLERNRMQALKGQAPLSLEAIVVHEGEIDPEALAVASTT